MQVWVNSEMSDDGRHVVGHTKSYVKVLLPYDAALFGSVAQVRPPPPTFVITTPHPPLAHLVLIART